jgi:hypothetical protein
MPVKARSRRLEPDTCQHFLHQTKRLTRRPFIVTAPAEYAVKGYGPMLVRAGAFDMVDLPAPSRGRSLSGAIRHALREGKALHGPDVSERAARPFTGGTLTFFSDRVELDGVPFLETGQFGCAEDLLRLLTTPNEHGRRPRIGGTRLQRLLDGATQNAIGLAVLRLRRRVADRMLRAAGVQVGHQDLIATAPEGYFVPDSIDVEDKTQDHPPAAVRCNPVHLADLAANARQHLIIETLCQRGRLTRGEVEKLCRVAPRTARRDLNELRDRGLVEFAGKGKAGWWQLCDPGICEGEA